MDVLSDVLETMRLKSAIYFRSDFAGPWGMEIESGPFAYFHLIARGHAVLKMENGAIINLSAGDLIMFPSGTSHYILDHPDSPILNSQEVIQSIWDGTSKFDGDETATTLICGHFESDQSCEHPFVQSLPELIHIKDMERRELIWFEGVCNQIISETDSGKNGSQLIANRLAEILFIHIIRAFMQREREDTCFLTALQDEKISKALQLMHKQPEHAWTLDELASESAMSRTLFANRFRDMVGVTPINYLTDWRMLKAKEYLSGGDQSLIDIAEQVGYQSEASFSRVFKKTTGQTPAAFRRNSN